MNKDEIIQAQATKIAYLIKQVERQNKETHEEFIAREDHYKRVEERLRSLEQYLK